MARTIRFEGRTISVPDDATDAEVAEIVEGTSILAPAAKPKIEFQWSDILQPVAAPLEVGTQIVTGVGSQVVAGLAGLLGGGTMEERDNRVRRIQEFGTYQPRTELGQGLSKVVSYPFEKGMEITKAAGGALGEAVAGEQGRIAGEVIGEQVIPVVGALAGGYGALRGQASKTAVAQQARIDKSFQDAARIDAAKLAVEKYGLSLDPVVSNPTLANKIRVTAAGQSPLNALLRKENEPKIVNALKEDIGLPIRANLSDPTVFSNALEAAAGPKRQIQKMAGLTDDGTIANSIDALMPEGQIGTSAAKKAVAKRIEEAKAMLAQDMTGNSIITEIEHLRSMARSIYKADKLKPKDRAIADAYQGMANAFESLIDQNLTRTNNTKLLSDYRVGRKQMAKIYALKDFTDLNTGLPNIGKLTRATAKDNVMDGAFADIGKIAGNFPEAVGVKSGAPGGIKELAQTHASRTGVGGTAGYMIGSAMGQPLVGAAIGAGLGELGGMLYGKRLATNPALQHRVSVPIDYRGLAQQQAMGIPAAQAAQNTISTPNLPIVRPHSGEYQPAGTPLPEQPYRPNWVPGRPGEAPDITPRPVGLLSDSANPLPSFRYERGIKSAAADEATAARESAAPRRPTGGGMLFDLDPISGRLRPMNQGVKGATPLTVESTGNALKSAVEKISSGQRFALSAEEHIAWNKRKVDLTEAVPQIRGLSDKALTEKMMDRQWVADTVRKLKDKAAGFADIERRAIDMRSKMEATKQRELLMDAAEQIEQGLQQPRPVASRFQGSKTREFQRNMLTGVE